MTISKIKEELNCYIEEKKKEVYAGFFKTGKGEYAEGDLFLGISIPNQRLVAKQYYKNYTPLEINELLKSPYHEHRLTALLIWILQYQKSKSEEEKKAIATLYLNNIDYINNWDLIDLSSDKILGAYYYEKDKKVLYDLIKDDNLWKKRIAIMSTFYFIKHNVFEHTIVFATLCLGDKRDLIQKASGWMLREIGKRDKIVLIHFLNQYSQNMPRTMLRYSIEKLNTEEKIFYMNKKK